MVIVVTHEAGQCLLSFAKVSTSDAAAGAKCGAVESLPGNKARRSALAAN